MHAQAMSRHCQHHADTQSTHCLHIVYTLSTHCLHLVYTLSTPYLPRVSPTISTHGTPIVHNVSTMCLHLVYISSTPCLRLLCTLSISCPHLYTLSVYQCADNMPSVMTCGSRHMQPWLAMKLSISCTCHARYL